MIRRAGVLVLLGGLLSACSGLGTVVDEDDPETEVPNLSMGRSIMEGLGAVPSRRIPINYSSRAPLVIPQDTSALAPPEDPNAVAARADWPLEPEVESARALRQADERQRARGDKNELVPASELMETRVAPRPLSPALEKDGPIMPSELKRGPTSMADTPLYDADGRPVRRALIEPPVKYLEPAPGVPVIIPEEAEAEGGLFSWLPW